MTSERIYQDNDGDWFFSKRGEHAGPFDSPKAAERELRLYLRRRNRLMNSDLFGTSFLFMKSVLRRMAA